jgi:hypothetical protein
VRLLQLPKELDYSVSKVLECTVTNVIQLQLRIVRRDLKSFFVRSFNLVKLSNFLIALAL